MLPLLPSEDINGHKGHRITNFVIKKKKSKKIIPLSNFAHTDLHNPQEPDYSALTINLPAS